MAVLAEGIGDIWVAVLIEGMGDSWVAVFANGWGIFGCHPTNF